MLRHVLAVRVSALRNLDIEVRFDPQEGLPRVRAEGSALEQVFLNLVVNAEYALEQTPSPRALRITTSLVEGEVRVEVEDNGAGVPPGLSERVFEPFFTTKPAGEGTGFGLAVAAGVVSQLGGTIRVSEAELGGARFSVWIPVGSDSRASFPGPESAWSGRPRTEVAETAEDAVVALQILVVDDEPSIRRALNRYFTRLGHLVTVAENGGRALELLDQCSPTGGYDVVLSDLNMPGTTGIELIAALQARGDDHADRCILMTGNSSRCEVARAVGALDAPVVFKPFDLDEVRRLVERVASGPH